jgi:hypothetical protein
MLEKQLDHIIENRNKGENNVWNKLYRWNDI